MKKAATSVFAASALALALVGCSGQGSNERSETVSVTRVIDPVAKTSHEAKSDVAVETVDSAFTAMREIRAARLAIFDGSGPGATALVEDAQAKLADARADLEKIHQGKSTEQAGDGLVPFDLSMAMTEDYSAKPEKAAAVREANGHLRRGDRAKAVETLRLADLNIETAAALLPLQAASGHLDQAAKMLANGQYYEANLQLKAIEDSVVVRIFDAEGKPKPSRSAKS